MKKSTTPSPSDPQARAASATERNSRRKRSTTESPPEAQARAASAARKNSTKKKSTTPSPQEGQARAARATKKNSEGKKSLVLASTVYPLMRVSEQYNREEHPDEEEPGPERRRCCRAQPAQGPDEDLQGRAHEVRGQVRRSEQHVIVHGRCGNVLESGLGDVLQDRLGA